MITFIRRIVVLLFVTTLLGSAQGAPAFPVRYSANNRYLVDQNGTPFPILGRTAWFVVSLAVGDYHTFIDDTASRGYSAIEMHVLDHDSRGNHPPFNGNGDAPFLKRLDGTTWNGALSGSAPDFTTPNQAYWSFVDGFLSYCESKGILVFMFPAYVGYDGGSQGWMQEMVANGTTKMQSYGAWIATRYQNQKNLVWMMGGDMGTGSIPFDPTQSSVENALLTGLKSVPGQQSVFFSAEWARKSIATDQTTFGAAMTLNGVYSSSDDVNLQGLRAYAYSPIEPAFLLEEPYDEEGADGNSYNLNATQPVRRFQWWGWLSTIGGYISGNGYVWPFIAPAWLNHLDTQGSRDMARLNAFIGSIAWYNLVPSGLGGMRTLVTAGNSSPDLSTYVAAAAAPDGTLMVAYVPPDHSGSITVDMGAMSGPARARWFDPTSGAYTSIGTGLPNTGSRSFTPPGNNSAGGTDWVLMVDYTSGNTSAAPTISNISDQSTTMNTPTAAVPFTIGDADTPVTNLTLSGNSSNPALVPTNNIVFGGSGSNRTVTVSPASGQTGSSTITVTVSDGTNSASDTFVLTVTAANTPPTISNIPDQTINEDTSTAALGFTVGDAETAAGSLTLSKGSSNPGLVPTNNIVFGGSGSNRTVTLTPAAGQTGRAVITITVSDGQMTASTSFTLTVNTVNAGLVAAYSFNEGTGTVVTDASGNGNNGTIGSATWTTSGKYGNALSFSGSSARVTINDSVSLHLTTGMTLEAWVSPTSVSSAWRDVVYKGNDNYYLMGTTTSSGKPALGGTFGGGNVNLYGVAALGLNTWTHLAGTYDGTTKRLYVNGVQVASQAQAGNILTSANPLQIGGDSIYGQTFQGKIDEMRVYNRALSASEIQTDMNTPVGGSSPSQAPTISNISDQSTTMNTPTAAVPFTIGDADTPVTNLTLSGNSSNPALVPTNNIVFGGSGSNRTVTVSPASGQTGSSTITVTVSDGTNSASDTFVLTVSAANTPPTISNIPDQTINEDTSTAALGFTVGDAETAAGSLALSKGSSNPGLVPTNNIVFGGSGSNRTVTLTPAAGQTGSSMITITVSDGQMTASTSFTLTVNTVNAGLVAAYSFNEGTGTVVTDASGNGNNGTIGSATWTTSGKYGNALSFSGSSARVTINDSVSLHLTTGMTLEAWVSPTSVSSAWRDVVYKGNDNYYLMGTTTSSGKPALGGTFGGGNVNLYGVAALGLNTWTHLAGTYDGTTKRLYVNGVQVASQAQAGNLLTSANPLQIGGDSIYGQTFQGKIDEVRVYNRALSAGEIQTDMNTPVGGSSPSQAPTISNISDQSTTMNTPTAAVPFTIGDADTPVTNLTLSGNSSNPALVPTNNIVFGGSGSNRTVTVSPASGQTGSSTITVTVSDGTSSASDTFVLTVSTQVTGTLSFTNTTSIMIPDSGAATPYPSTINVSGMSGTVSNVTVTLRGLSHTWGNDIDVLLLGPGAQKMILMANAGTGPTANNANLTFSDGAAGTLPQNGSLVSGTYKPTDYPPATTFPPPAPSGPYATTLSTFNGQSANGAWSLFVFDDGTGDQGSFSGGWSLTITTGGAGARSSMVVEEPPWITSVALDGQGVIRVTVSGEVGLSYALEASSDLSNWTKVDVQDNTTGTIVFNDQPTNSFRFYRAVSVPK